MSSRERDRSPRSADTHSGGSRDRSKHEQRADRRSRSRSRERDRHHHHKSHRSRSRSGERRHHHHHHSKHSRRSPHRSHHGDSGSSSGVKLEPEQSSSHADAARSRVKHEGTTDIKSERSHLQMDSHSAAGSSAYAQAAASSSAAAASLSHGLKSENEPTQADLVAALSAAAAAASAPRLTQSATAPSAAPAVVPVSQQEVNYKPSGLLAAAAHTVNGVEVKYQEPIDARMPDQEWRLYMFKDQKPLDEPLRIHSRSMYMIGRDDKVCDLPIAHPSCSKQHAVIQYRLREVLDADGLARSVIKPYLMDLGSTNGTFLMGIKREPQKYYELLPNDVIRFGFSTREYVLINSTAAAAAKAKAAAAAAGKR